MRLKLAELSVVAIVVAAFNMIIPQAYGESEVHAVPLGDLYVSKPAFLHLLPSDDGMEQLMISSFAMFAPGRVYSMPLLTNSADWLQASYKKLHTISRSIAWPNHVTAVPESVLGPGKVVVGSGFLIPGYKTGTISLVDVATGDTQSIVKPKTDFFYHQAVWADVNNDGRLDIITARAKLGWLGQHAGELLWIEQPLDKSQKIWTEHLIASGPDVNFVVTEHHDDLAIIATEFFNKRLSMHWRHDGQWAQRIIDETLGAAFDVSLTDLNGDGHEDLLVTNHEAKEKAAVFAYEIPDDWQHGAWTRHTILGGIATKVTSPAAASPGSALTWSHPGRKSDIFVAGDGSGKAHWLKPNSEDPKDWTYTEQVLLDAGSTIGHMALGAPDSDGNPHLFVPDYDQSRIHVFKLIGRTPAH
jgi:hypothetical protein